jgi:hypothetical protein
LHLKFETKKSENYWKSTLLKKGVFYKWPCDSIFELQWPLGIHHFFNVVSVIKQVAWVAKVITHHIYIYIVQFIAVLLQLYQNNSFSTTMQFHYNHNVMLTLLIFIHPSKFDMCHHEDFFFFFFEVLISIIYYNC